MSHLPRPAVIATAAPLFAVALHRRTPVAASRWLIEALGVFAQLPNGTVARPVVLGDRPAERVTVGASERQRAILYLHGGGYVVGSPRTYRALAAHLARAAGAVVYTLDYRLAPEHPYPAALCDAVAAFRWLVEHEGYPPRRIALAGDSAGGGLAVATARVLVDEGVAPAALGLASPWVDPSDLDMKPRDLVINRAWGSWCAEQYRAEAPADDPGYAPIHGRLDGLPPMLIHCASAEALQPQVARFAARVAAAGSPVSLETNPRLWHSAHAFAGTLREASDAVQEMGTFLRAQLDASPLP